MAGVLQHLRSSTLDKRPNPASMVDGQVAINYASGAPGMFFKDSNGSLVKVGPVHVGSAAPNAVPASGGTAGNSLGEQWLDTSGGTYVFKIWDGAAWRSEAGEFVNVTGDTMTGALGIIAGSAGSPSLFISGDSNTGIYSPGADQMAISTGGTGRLFVDSSGNVGINAAPPTAANAAGYRDFLVKGGSTNRTGILRLQDGDGTDTVILYANEVNGLELRQELARPISFWTNGTEKARIDSSGRLLVGTSSASGTNTLFESSSTAANSANVALVKRNSGTADQAGQQLHFYNFGPSGTARVADTEVGNIRFYGSQPTSGAAQEMASIQCAADLLQTGTNTSGRLVFSTCSNGSVSPTERMRIDSSGRVGIGTTSPAYQLDVAGSAGVDVFGANNGANYLTLRSGYAPSAVGGIGFQCYQGDIGNYDALAIYGYGGARFNINGTERLRIKSNGDIYCTGTGAGVTGSYTPYYGFRFLQDNGQSALLGTITAQGGAAWAGDLVFSTKPGNAIPDENVTERMRITNTGRVMIGATSGSATRLEIAGTATLMTLINESATGSTYETTINFTDVNGNSRGTIKVNNAGTQYNTVSDYRLKQNVAPIADATVTLKRLKPCKFNFIVNPDVEIDGFLAHEVQDVIPEAVSGTKDEVDADGNPVYQGIDQSKLVPLLTAALQEALQKIEDLEARLTAAGI